jgi:hypothetical protein
MKQNNLTERFVIAFADSRNYTRYYNGTEKGADNPIAGIFFATVEDAEKYINDNNFIGCWVEDLEGEIQ